MMRNLAASITKAASKQTYYTFRFLADRARVEDAYRSYAYFRWVDDILDANSISGSERRAFIERQDYRLAPEYPQGRGLRAGMKMSGSALSLALFPQVRK